MIYDSLKNLKKYAGTIPYTEQVDLYFAGLMGALPQNGIEELMGKDLYVNVQETVTEDARERRWESHAEYADLQCLLMGNEAYGIYGCGKLPVSSDPHPEKDCWFYQPELPESAMLTLRPGEFVWFAPGELHKPCCVAGKPCIVKKAIFKIRCK